MNGAEAVARALRAAGVDVAFGLPGAHNLALWPACAGAGIRIVGMRHEQGCAYAADGYARATGRTGVALVTTGPGAANTVAAVGEAWASRVPLVVIATDIPAALRRAGTYRGVLHECTDQAALFAPITKARFTVDDPDHLEESIARAMTTAATPPARPVYVGIPFDFLAADAHVEAATTPPAGRDGPAPWFTAAVDAAQRPLIWVGGGARDAGDAVDAVARKLGAPVVTTYQARGILSADHPLLVGAPPHEPEVTELIARADLAIVLGSDLDQMNTMGWRLPLPARRIAVNVDAADARKNYSMEGVLEGDVRIVAVLVRELRERAPWAGDVTTIGPAIRERLSGDEATRDAVEFLERTEAALPADAMVFADMCVAGYWLAGHLRVGVARGLHYPMGWGTLGFALPAAIGAATARPVAPTVAVVGDGGALFALGELSALHELDAPCTIVVVDDHAYGMLQYGHDEQPVTGLALPPVDFAQIAAGFGVNATTVDGLGTDYAKALAEAVASGAPALVHVHASLMPPVTTTPRWPLKEESR